MHKFNKNVAFKLLNKLSELLFLLRESHLVKLSNWLDYQTSKYAPTEDELMEELYDQQLSKLEPKSDM